MANKGIIYGTIATTALVMGVMGHVVYTDIQNDRKEAKAILERHKAEFQDSKSRLENLVSDSEVIKASKELKESKRELYETADKMVFESNPDKETVKVIGECQKPYFKVLDDCMDQYGDEQDRCRRQALERSPEEQAKFSACVDKYGNNRKGIRTCQKQFPYTEESDKAYRQCHDTFDKKIDACAKSSYDTYRECGNKALEQGFKRFKEQKNPEMRK